MLHSPGVPLGALLRAQLPGTAGVRWLRQEQLLPTTNAPALTEAHWRSLYECWSSAERAPGPGAPVARGGRRPSAHGHAGGAAPIPRWGQ